MQSEKRFSPTVDDHAFLALKSRNVALKPLYYALTALMNLVTTALVLKLNQLRDVRLRPEKLLGLGRWFFTFRFALAQYNHSGMIAFGDCLYAMPLSDTSKMEVGFPDLYDTILLCLNEQWQARLSIGSQELFNQDHFK